MNVNLHAHAPVRIAISEVCGPTCPILKLFVGGAEVSIFLHDEAAEQTFADIENAIRAFQMSKEASE